MYRDKCRGKNKIDAVSFAECSCSRYKSERKRQDFQYHGRAFFAVKSEAEIIQYILGQREKAAKE
jgi:hypothetical protein